MKNFDIESFIRDLENVPWESAYIFENVDDIWSHWKGLCNEVLDLHAPRRFEYGETNCRRSQLR